MRRQGRSNIFHLNFLAAAASLGQWMGTMVRNYARHCEELDRKLDAKLRSPVNAKLQELQAGDGELADSPADDGTEPAGGGP